MDKETMQRAAYAIKQMLRELPVSDINVVVNTREIVAQAKVNHSGGQLINVSFRVEG
jgi:hypothetical protein